MSPQVRSLLSTLDIYVCSTLLLQKSTAFILTVSTIRPQVFWISSIFRTTENIDIFTAELFVYG